jgi:lipid-binding SYLF domain-containing protein
MMKKNLLLILSVVLLVSLSACLAPSGDTPEQKRAAIQRMHNETLGQLYRQRPTAESVVSKAAGYAVFSNVNAQYIFVGGGGGYGIAVNQSSGQKTYMKMAQAGLGLGLGVQDVRVVFVFHSAQAFSSFVNSGWEFGGQADAAAKARDKGGAVTGEVSIDAETTMYTMSESGLMAKVNLAGTKYWKDDNLNY